MAGVVNAGLALALGASLPAALVMVGTLSVGLLGYGISLVFFLLALRGLGTARTGAYFSIAPFIGTAVSLALLGESTSAAFWHHRHQHDFDWNGDDAHEHWHQHEALVHKHPHFPDTHHRHKH